MLDMGRLHRANGRLHRPHIDEWNEATISHDTKDLLEVAKTSVVATDNALPNGELGGPPLRVSPRRSADRRSSN